MPYFKTVKDQDGAIAEAVSTEIAALSNLSHPATDTPTIKIEPNYQVTLPTFHKAQLLSDKMLDKIIPTSNIFLTSLGQVIAFNWFIGQGDLNANNVAICKETCHPFDFDCCFQAIQSEQSFARKRGSSLEDLDALTQDLAIINAALHNLNTITKIDLSCESLTFNNKQLQQIQQGFQGALTTLAYLEESKLSAIIKKHITLDEQQASYLSFLQHKKEQALRMICPLTLTPSKHHSALPTFFMLFSGLALTALSITLILIAAPMIGGLAIGGAAITAAIGLSLTGIGIHRFFEASPSVAQTDLKQTPQLNF